MMADRIWADYDRAEKMLQPVPYPESAPTLPKLKLLEKQAGLLGPEYEARFYRPPISMCLVTLYAHRP